MKQSREHVTGNFMLRCSSFGWCTYCYKHVGLIEVVSDRHHVSVEVLELHLGEAEHHVAEPRAEVDLPLQDPLPPTHQDHTIDCLNLGRIQIFFKCHHYESLAAFNIPLKDMGLSFDRRFLH